MDFFLCRGLYEMKISALLLKMIHMYIFGLSQRPKLYAGGPLFTPEYNIGIHLHVSTLTGFA